VSRSQAARAGVVETQKCFLQHGALLQVCFQWIVGEFPLFQRSSCFLSSKTFC